MLASGTLVFAAEDVVVDADMVIEHEAQGDVMPISEVETEEPAADAETTENAEATEDTEAVEEVEATEETTAEEAEKVEETEETAEVVIDTAAMVKNAFVLDGAKIELAEGMGTLIEKDGVVFVPARAALEAAGYQVSWSDAEQMVMGANQTTGAMFIMQLGNTLLFYLDTEGVEGKITMEAAPFKNEVEWRTYVPLSDFAKVLGYKVGFDAENATINLSK
ncbi:MAG: copper amine oxidase N-terminal domain-containing protein [Clostridia bacterium]|nr:copper amine oxidase N-terminal domain-containing protein [Oscillospiraceae bacterium]MBQ7959863.1 copper amine oxidase N-terminal domain-containing protein [Clostridia bacterium]